MSGREKYYNSPAGVFVVNAFGYCLVGIAVFLGWTAYDTQKIKAFYNYYASSPEMLAKASIFSALQLYLDFVNLFLYLLRFLGNKRR